MNKRDLTQIKKGESVNVVEINGGQKFRDKVDAMGLRVGSRIIKISAQILSGPITIRIGNTQLAIGHGMAKQILADGKN